MLKVFSMNYPFLDSLKPSFCTFMGVYVVRHLKETISKSNSEADLQIMANDFCANVKDSIKERLLFLNELFSLEP